MQQETGRLIAGNAVAGGAIVGMNTNGSDYIPWFERVYSVVGIEFTGNDITHTMSLLVAVLVITNTVMAIKEINKKKKQRKE